MNNLHARSRWTWLLFVAGIAAAMAIAWGMQTARAADSPGTDSVEQTGDTLQVGSVVI